MCISLDISIYVFMHRRKCVDIHLSVYIPVNLCLSAICYQNRQSFPYQLSLQRNGTNPPSTTWSQVSWLFTDSSDHGYQLLVLSLSNIQCPLLWSKMLPWDIGFWVFCCQRYSRILNSKKLFGNFHWILSRICLWSFRFNLIF